MDRLAVLVPAAAVAASLACSSPAAAPAASDATRRTIAQGALTGVVQENGSLAWMNIPYAKPPVGGLRWKLPQKPDSWKGTYAATQRIQPCLQFASGLTAGIPDPDGDGIVGSEDCLYLSVYAPATTAAGRPLPVMYWIFGGGNNSGYAGDYNGGNLAASRQVVVVTVNYRLGSLGWFIHPAIVDSGATGAAAGGNWATVDTISGLEWVRDNIAAFGGDPGNVTIFGESAGASNVLSLVTSPMAKGLFHRAIVESGGIGTVPLAQGINLTDDAEPGSPFSSREMINKILIRDGKAASRDEATAKQRAMSDAEIKSLLYSQDAAKLLLLYNPGKARNYPAPKKFRDGAVFVTQEPLEQLSSGQYNKVPIILGTNRDERRIYMYRDRHWAEVIKNDPAEYVRSTKYVSDVRKLLGVDDLARIMSAVQPGSAYAYRFDWDEQATSPDGVNLAIAVGAAHSTEMAFVFGDWNVGFIRGGRLYDPQTNPGRDRLSKSMMSYWANFAYAGQPGRGRDGDLPEWLPWQNGAGNSKMILLDSERDGGIRMSNDEVTLDSIKAEFIREKFSNADDRCVTYRDTFAGTKAFDRSQYVGFGCDPRTIEGPASSEP